LGMQASIPKPVDAAPLLRLIGELTEPGEAPVIPSFDPSGVIVPLFRPEEEPQAPAINAVKLLELEDLGGSEFVDELLTQYVIDAESLMAAIRASVADDNVDGFRDGTHALRSSGANIGADAVAGLCLHLQRIERGEFEAKAESHVASLEAELERVRGALAARRRKPAILAQR
jgi:two-component system, sensor histidine kinase RpfC